jgi:hypothetical protein
VQADDFGRTHRQQKLILAILAGVKKPSSLPEAGSIVASFAQHLTVDSELAKSSLVELAFRMRGISAQKIETATLPGYVDLFGEMSVVKMEHPQADNVIVAFANGQPLTTNIASLHRLEVLNGNGIEGAATRMSELLEQQGFEIAAVDDADRSDYEATTIIVRPEALEQARALVNAIGFGEVSTGALADDIDAIVIVGLDADRSLRAG